MERRASKPVRDDDQFRYERKFQVTSIFPTDAELVVRLLPAGFSEEFPPRYVNNIYFDSFGFQSFADNVDGISNRKKIRIRWYGEQFGRIEKPVLEHKIKKNLLGTKRSYVLPPFELNSEITGASVVRLVEGAEIPEIVKEEMRAVAPTLLNRYFRKYFRSADGKYRLTLDVDMTYRKASRFSSFVGQEVKAENATILELKYSRDEDDLAREITNDFPFRMTKNSKYVNGIFALYE